jgi:hypothetical protein
MLSSFYPGEDPPSLRAAEHSAWRGGLHTALLGARVYRSPRISRRVFLGSRISAEFAPLAASATVRLAWIWMGDWFMLQKVTKISSSRWTHG